MIYCKVDEREKERSKLCRVHSLYGVGMENIEDIARKYDGFTSFGVENGVFWLRCGLSMCGRESA